MRKEIYENQESSDTLPFHWEFGKEEITLKVSSYAYGNGLAVLMYSQSEGELELFSDLTVNLPGGYGLKTQEAFVSGDFTRDKLAFIQENRLGKVLPGQACSGFATYTPVAFDLSRLSRYDREGVEEFCRQWGLDIPKEQEKSKEIDRKKEKRKREIEVYGSKNEQRDPQLSGVHVYGTEPAPVYFLPACHRCGGRDLFWPGKVCGTGDDRVAVHLRGCPIRSLWFLPVPWHECGAVCLGVYQV